MLVSALLALVLGTIGSGFFLSRVSLLLLVCGAVVFLAGSETSGGDLVSAGFLIR